MLELYIHFFKVKKSIVLVTCCMVERGEFDEQTYGTVCVRREDRDIKVSSTVSKRFLPFQLDITTSAVKV